MESAIVSSHQSIADYWYILIPPLTFAQGRALLNTVATIRSHAPGRCPNRLPSLNPEREALTAWTFIQLPAAVGKAIRVNSDKEGQEVATVNGGKIVSRKRVVRLTRQERAP